MKTGRVSITESEREGSIMAKPEVGVKGRDGRVPVVLPYVHSDLVSWHGEPLTTILYLSDKQLEELYHALSFYFFEQSGGFRNAEA